MLQENTVSQYMMQVPQRRNDEVKFWSNLVLNTSLYARVMNEFDGRMVADHLAAIHNECHAMVQNEMQQDLRIAFAVLKVLLSPS